MMSLVDIDSDKPSVVDLDRPSVVDLDKPSVVDLDNGHNKLHPSCKSLCNYYNTFTVVIIFKIVSSSILICQFILTVSFIQYYYNIKQYNDEDYTFNYDCLNLTSSGKINEMTNTYNRIHAVYSLIISFGFKRNFVSNLYVIHLNQITIMNYWSVLHCSFCVLY
jgi:hypothetical protein